MNKLRSVLLLIGATAGCYVVLALFINFLSDRVVATNSALASAHNMSQYPGTSGFLLYTPWLLYFVPAVIAIVWLVVILKRKEV